MMLLVDSYPTPKTGYFEIEIKRSGEMQISAEQAHKIAAKWASDTVSNMLQAEPPTLALGEQIVWRVPIIFYSTHQGRIGIAGTVDIDIQTGILHNSEQSKQAIIASAQKMATKLPPYQPPQPLADEFIPAHLPRASIAST